MRIANVSVSKNFKDITLSADITFRGKSTQHAYFTINKKYEALLSYDTSVFFAAVLLPCMKTHEDIYIDGAISAQLLENSNKIMTLVKKWNIGLNPIKIHAQKITKDKKKSQFVGEFFTAGVDSFYTYLKMKKTKDRITHLILVHGFDIPLENKSFFAEVKKTIEKIAKVEKVQTVIIETNIGQIVERKLIWDFSHGGALASVALFLRGGLKKVFISDAVRNDELFPYGTHPVLNKLWSTETLSVKSVGGEYNRFNKIFHLVSKSPLALSYLRVCTQNLKGKYNCSHCHKCLVTMIYLYSVGVLHKSKTFEKHLDLNEIKNMYYDYKFKYNTQAEQILAYLKKENREQELQDAIIFSLEQSRKPRVMKRMTQLVASWDQKYNDRRLYQFVFKSNQDNDRNVFFKFLLKRGILK
jgi:hypothetical protein